MKESHLPYGTIIQSLLLMFIVILRTKGSNKSISPPCEGGDGGVVSKYDRDIQ